MVRTLRARLLALTWLPEFNVAVFAIFLNYPWEFTQVPLFDRMPEAPHWEAIKTCTRATFGDAAIMLVAYWTVAVKAGNRKWILEPCRRQVGLLILTGVSITTVIEHLALSGSWVEEWSYAPAMPTVPVLGVGLSPLLQWVVLPPLVVWFVRRQLTPPPAP